MTQDPKSVPQAADNGNTAQPPTAVASGVLNIGTMEVECYVLSDERRVISQRAIIRALSGGHGNGNLGQYLGRLPAKYAALSVGTEIEIVPPRGGPVVKARTAEWFVDLLKAYDEASDEGLLKARQLHLAKQARVVLRSLAGVGLTALIDEATNYQAVRASHALRRLMDRLLLKEAAPWAMMWTPEVVGALCKVFRAPYDGKGFPKWLAGVAGEVYDIVLGAEVHGEVRRLNPDRPDRDKHHQFFQDELRTIAREDLLMVKAIADQSASKSDFWQRLRRHYHGTSLQLPLKPLH